MYNMYDKIVIYLNEIYGFSGGFSENNNHAVPHTTNWHCHWYFVAAFNVDTNIRLVTLTERNWEPKR